MNEIKALPGNEKAKSVYAQLEKALNGSIAAGVDAEAALTAVEMLSLMRQLES